MLLGTLSVCGYSSLGIYFNNADRTEIKNALMPMLVFCVMGGVVFGLCYVVTKSVSKSMVGCGVLMLFVTLFRYIEDIAASLFSSLRYWHVLIIGLVVIGHALYFLWKRVPEKVASVIALLMTSVFFFSNAAGLVMALPQITGRGGSFRAASSTSPEISLDQTGNAADLPNVYYFIFDEMASFSVMEEYFDCDNSAFADVLAQKGFSVMDDSYNEVAATSIVLPNLLNLDYLADPSLLDVYTAEELAELSRQAELFRLAKAMGYTVETLGDAENYYSSDAGGRPAAENTTDTGETLSELILDKSVFYPAFGRKASAAILGKLQAVKSYFGDQASYSGENSKIVFTYFSFPHVPFVVDSAGNRVSEQNRVNLTTPVYYREQYLYACGYIDELTDRILENDPEAVIIIQSDHGSRDLLDSRTGERVIPYRERCRIFNAVYYGGQPMPDCAGKSGVNTLRTVFSALWGADLPDVEVPYYTLEEEETD